MKKVIIAATLICATALSHAATYNWTMRFASSPDDMNPQVGKVYAFDANVYTVNAIASDLATKGADVLNNALGNSGSAFDGCGNINLAGAGLTDNGAEPPAKLYADMFAVIVAKDGTGKEFFYTYDGFSPVEITSAVTSGAANFVVDYVGPTGAPGSTGWTAVAVPEPTSGLLLLLGVAGLALRRRRA